MKQKKLTLLLLLKIWQNSPLHVLEPFAVWMTNSDYFRVMAGILQRCYRNLQKFCYEMRIVTKYAYIL